MEYPQKIYNALFRHRGSPLHSVPLEKVTRDELKLLAFVHGRDSIPPESIKFLGEAVVTMKVRAGVGHEKEGQEIEVPVASQADEYKRLARKYDVLADLEGIGRGRKYVEDCFKVRLDDFEDNIFAEVDPLAAIDAAAVASELKAQETAAEKHDREQKDREGARGPSLAGAFAKAGASEGVRA